jgi:hypothetical protein
MYRTVSLTLMLKFLRHSFPSDDRSVTRSRGGGLIDTFAMLHVELKVAFRSLHQKACGKWLLSAYTPCGGSLAQSLWEWAHP